MYLMKKVQTPLRFLFLILLIFCMILSCTIPVGPGWDKPDAPELSITTESSRTSLDLLWETYSGAEEYNLYVSDNPDGVFSLFQGNLSETKYSVTPDMLFPKMFSFFKVTAVLPSGETEKSWPVEGRFITGNLSIVSFQENSANPDESVLTLEWEGIQAVTGYQIYYAYYPEGIYYILPAAGLQDLTYDSHYILTPSQTNGKYRISFLRSRAKDAYFKVRAAVYNSADQKYYYSYESTALLDKGSK